MQDITLPSGINNILARFNSPFQRRPNVEWKNIPKDGRRIYLTYIPRHSSVIKDAFS